VTPLEQFSGRLSETVMSETENAPLERMAQLIWFATLVKKFDEPEERES